MTAAYCEAAKCMQAASARKKPSHAAMLIVFLFCYGSRRQPVRPVDNPGCQAKPPGPPSLPANHRKALIRSWRQHKSRLSARYTGTSSAGQPPENSGPH
ncbi:hypothetical protein BDP81DRAFT_391041 [Colletotrichum phormii]|uniref:Uncharacterized protein n=1 Tax=Colletotrichum phormii TaxID=359342 RepID=A0AAI9ZY39_9PEZI|nr:uncharacterized protein BDP81DRAFT_391041 [Colletotrichum phormii]KAK1640318.1 hypothetical protein BDP81DRAFT_391041 [Colletotrichum phormii]